jgi:archaea-specific RecJ-like exonuclease
MKQKRQGFHRDFHKKKMPSAPLREINISDINVDLLGRRFSLLGKIENIAQTGGPTLFLISDGTGTLALKGFIAPGKRAYPELNEEDIISATVQINEYNEAFEGEILSINKLPPTEAERLNAKIEAIQREGAKPLTPQFMVKSPILDKLRERFIKAATEIRLAVLQSRPIIIRHHNDVDGYSAGFVLERAILPLIEKQHGGGKAAWEFFVRAPCQAPFYDIEDSIRDTATSLRNEAKFSNKMPLIIITDNGSTEQDLIGIQQGRVHGMDFIVVDHHPYEQDVISSEVLVHINPFLVGEEGSAFSAGMLSSELARFISDIKSIEQIPGMAALADRIDLANPKTVEEYIKIAESKGYTKKLLSDIATVIDFVSAKLRFMEAREYIEVVFGEPRERQKALVALMTPFIKGLEKRGLEIAKSAAKTEKVSEVTLQTIDINKVFPGFGFYPKPGKCVGLLHDYLQEESKVKRLITLGLLDSAITFRATDEANFSVRDFISHLRKNLPEAFVEGGGHKNAGSINFVPNKREAILKFLHEFVKSRN